MATGRQTRKLRIRPARREDAGRIAALSRQLGYPSSTAQIARRLASILGDPEHAVFVAERASGEVAGWVHAFASRLVESDPHAEIGGLVVDKRWRGQGAGKLLMRAAEQWAKRRRLGSVYLRSNVIRRDAHAFYERLGYKNIKTQHAFRKAL